MGTPGGLYVSDLQEQQRLLREQLEQQHQDFSSSSWQLPYCTPDPPSSSQDRKRPEERASDDDMWGGRKPIVVFAGVGALTALACFLMPASLRPLIFAAAALAVAQLLSPSDAEAAKAAAGASARGAAGGLTPLPPPAIPLASSARSSPPLGSLQEKFAGAVEGVKSAGEDASRAPVGTVATSAAAGGEAEAEKAPVAVAAPAAAPAEAPAPAPAASTATPVPAPATPAAAAPSTGPGESESYIAPGARAMAAAMKAKADRAAGQAAGGAATGPQVPSGLVVLYGSQTGNAMEIAKTIDAEAKQRGIPSHVHALNDYSLDKLRSVSVAVFVVSTTGDGDPPENCDRFIGALQRRTHPTNLLGHLKYTVCGLGDSNYTRYMAIPRIFTRRLPELGAVQMGKGVEADEVDGLEDVIEAWTPTIWKPIEEALAAPAAPLQPIETADAAAAGGGAGAGVEQQQLEKLVGVPPLQQCRIRLEWTDERREEEPGKPLPAAAAAAAAAADDTAAAADDTAAAAPAGATAPPEGPFSHEHPLLAPVLSASYLTADWSDRVVVHAELDVSAAAAAGVAFAAGDSLGVIPSNHRGTVEGLLKRLGADGDRVFAVVDGESKEVGAAAGVGAAGGAGAAAGAAAAAAAAAAESNRDLGHIPSRCTLRHAFTHCCDVHGAPKKGLLRILAEYCADEREKHRLMLLSSRGGREAYKDLIAERRPMLLELLLAFPSCRPDVGHLLDALPPLVARFYSLSSAPKGELGAGVASTAAIPESSSSSSSASASPASACSVSFAFSVVQMPLLPLLPELMPTIISSSSSSAITSSSSAITSSSSSTLSASDLTRPRVFRGVCSTWLEGMLPLHGDQADRQRKQRAEATETAADGIVPFPHSPSPSSPSPVLLSIFPRAGGRFRHPASLSSPLIMIGPGTGVAPFRGFLQERRAMMKRERERERARRESATAAGGVDASVGASIGASWLFFGCRRAAEDFLYRSDLEAFVADGTLGRMEVAFSREKVEKVYVQHKMSAVGAQLAPLLLQADTHVFICGDGATMVKDVHSALLHILEEHVGQSAPTAAAHLHTMMGQGRYVKDVWS